ncbi:MAG TPA: hypothetical protein VGM72_06565 [Micropepsaceae bacterium]|jgi:hypothetical protein
MRRFLFAASFLLFADLAMAAAIPSAPIPPPPLPAPQPACVDTRDSADYVPGVDAYGRSVAPADLPGSTTDVQVGTQVYADVRTANPQLRGAGVVVNLPGLQARPPCPQSAPPKSSVTIH